MQELCEFVGILVDSALAVAVSDIAAGAACSPAVVAQDVAAGVDDQMVSVWGFALNPWDVGQ